MPLFSVTGNGAVIIDKYYPPIILDDADYELGLISLETFNSIPNIDKSNNKFHFITPYGREAEIEISEGSYEIDDIDKYLNKEVTRAAKAEAKKVREYKKHNKHTEIPDPKYTFPVLEVRGNNNTLKCEIKSNFDIDFTKPNSIGGLLGFKQKMLKAGSKHVSDFSPKISKINAICVECNIVSDSYRGGEKGHIIYEFFPMVPPGYKICMTPSQPIYLKLNTKQVDEVVLKLIDQDGNLVNLRGELVTVLLHLREIK